MLLIDNIIYDLQNYGGITSVWNSILSTLNKEKLPVSVLSSANKFKYPGINVFKSLKDRKLPLLLRRYLDVNIDGVDVFHSSYFRVHKSKKVKNIVTVHDFTYEKFDKGIRKVIHLKQKKHALKRASAVICVSENTKNDLLEYHPWLAPEIIHVIYNGYNKSVFYPLEKSIVKKGNNYFLSIGGRNVHKNFEFTLELMSMDIVKENNIKLVVVGGGEFTTKELTIIKKNQIENCIIYKSNVSDESLNELYNNAFALIYPSKYEGFGIPPLEALAAGCPVICSNKSSIPEVVEDSGLYINCDEVETAIPHIERLLNKEERNNIKNNGYIQANKFSWEKTGLETMNLYKKLLKTK